MKKKQAGNIQYEINLVWPQKVVNIIKIVLIFLFASF